MGSLRKVEGVYFDLDLPEVDKKVKYRAMKVREAKVLMTALSMKDPGASANAIIDIVEAATRADFDVSSLPLHLTDLIFMKIYIKSSSSKAMTQVTCGNMVDDVENPGEQKKCGHVTKFELPLSSADVVVPEGYSAEKSFDVGDGQSIVLVAPNLEAFKALRDTESVDERFVFSGVKKIIDSGEDKFPVKDFSLEEFNAWLDDLDQAAVDPIFQFFKELPYLYLKIESTCESCGKKEVFELKGLNDFFI